MLVDRGLVAYSRMLVTHARVSHGCSFYQTLPRRLHSGMRSRGGVCALQFALFKKWQNVCKRPDLLRSVSDTYRLPWRVNMHSLSGTEASLLGSPVSFIPNCYSYVRLSHQADHTAFRSSDDPHRLVLPSWPMPPSGSD